MDFCLNNFCVIKAGEEDVSFVPSILRRKLNSIDKMTVCALSRCFTPDVQKIVFASPNGEFERLLSLVEQRKREGAVSPLTFSSSVHNYPVGLFLLLKKASLPYVAISGGQETFHMGLLTALSCSCNNVLYCFADENFCKCLNITKPNPLVRRCANG